MTKESRESIQWTSSKSKYLSVRHCEFDTLEEADFDSKICAFYVIYNKVNEGAAPIGISVLTDIVKATDGILMQWDLRDRFSEIMNDDPKFCQKILESIGR